MISSSEVVVVLCNNSPSQKYLTKQAVTYINVSFSGTRQQSHRCFKYVSQLSGSLTAGYTIRLKLKKETLHIFIHTQNQRFGDLTFEWRGGTCSPDIPAGNGGWYKHFTRMENILISLWRQWNHDNPEDDIFSTFTTPSVTGGYLIPWWISMFSPSTRRYVWCYEEERTQTKWR